MRFRCNTCLGEYEDTAPDGARYMHICSPIVQARVTRAGVVLFVPLDQIQPSDTVTVFRGEREVETLVSALQPGDTRLRDRHVPRPPGEQRDETPVPVPVSAGAPSGADRPIKAEGRGRTPI